MKEQILRKMIRTEIKSSLKEADVTNSVERETGKIESNAGVKMLKRALSQGSPKQQAAGLIKVITAISGGSTAVKNALIQMLKQSGMPEPEMEEPAMGEPEMEEPNGAMEEADMSTSDKFSMGRRRTAGLQQKDMGGAADIKRASGMFADIAKLEPAKKAKALAYLIKQAGVDKQMFDKFKIKIGAYLNQLGR